MAGPQRAARAAPPDAASSKRHGVARVISKSGRASRSEGARWVRDGRVRVNGRVVRDPEFAVRAAIDRVEIDGQALTGSERRVLMLNKPRGLVTTASDERGRDTVYRCLAGADLPWLAPVGRLDAASEGLLLFCNDPAWAARLTDPLSGPPKTYHVQVDRVPGEELLQQIRRGARLQGQHLAAQSVRGLRAGARHAWLEIVLSEGRNRHIRRLLAHFELSVLRLVRVRIGELSLGSLPKAHWRMLSAREVAALLP